MNRVLLWPLLLTLFACGTPEPSSLDLWIESNDKVRVLCTIAMINDVVEAIGGDAVHCLTLIDHELDPHSYELVKGDDEKLAAADMIVYNGLGLEHAPALRTLLEGSPKALSVGDAVRKVSPSEILFVDIMPDPHIWMDISLWSQTIDPIKDRLVQLVPEQRSAIEKRAEDLRQRMLKAHGEIKEMLSQIPENRRYIVTSHDAFAYFCRAYLREGNETDWRRRCQAPEGLAPDGQLSPLDIDRIVKHLEKHSISVIFSESNVNQDSIRKVVDAGSSLGLKIRISENSLYGDSMGPHESKGDGYLKMISHNARVIHGEILREGQ